MSKITKNHDNDSKQLLNPTLEARISKDKYSPFKKGDVFFVQDSKGETFTHSGIRLGQWLTGNSYPQIVHAGIALDLENTIEMDRNGIDHFKPTNVHGQKVIIFRFKDQKVSDLAADLAYNMEGSYLEEHYPQLKTSSEKIKYAYKRAFQSSFNNSCAMNSCQLAELEKLVNDFDFKEDGAIKNKLYCSELVVLVYAMSQLILANSHQDTVIPMECNLHLTDPSKLYSYLSEQPNWERFELNVVRQENNVTFRHDSSVASLTASLGLFSHAVQQEKFTTKDEALNQKNNAPSFDDNDNVIPVFRTAS